MIAGLVLAAGAGRRFGGAKQLARLEGQPLLQRVIEQAAACERLDRLVVVIGSNAEEVEAQVAFGRSLPVRCDTWAEGMSASLRRGLQELKDADVAVIFLGDQPGISPAMVDALLDSLGPGQLAVRASFGGRPGHPVVVRSALFRPLCAVTGDQGGREILARAGVRLVPCDHHGDGRDVDTPADLHRAEMAAREPRRGPAGRDSTQQS